MHRVFLNIVWTPSSYILLRRNLHLSRVCHVFRNRLLVCMPLHPVILLYNHNHALHLRNLVVVLLQFPLQLYLVLFPSHICFKSFNIKFSNWELLSRRTIHHIYLRRPDFLWCHHSLLFVSSLDALGLMVLLRLGLDWWRLVKL